MRRVVVPLVVAIVVVACGSSGTDSTPPNRRRAPATGPPVDVPLRALRNAPPGLAILEGDGGSHLYAQLGLGTPNVEFVRLDPHTGAVAATYPARPVPPGTPYSPGPSTAYVGDRVVVLDGARDDAVVLDADTLEELGRIAIPPGRRTEVPADAVAGHHGFWIGHKTYDIDALAGNHTAVGLSRIDVRRMAITATLPTPACGSKGGIEVDASTLVDATECSYEVEIRDLRRGATRSVPGYQVRPEVALLGGQVWVRWSDVGYAGSLDLRTGRYRLLDFGADGPLLTKLYVAQYAAGSVWLLGTPADSSLGQILFRVDPQRVQIVARARLANSVFVEGRGYTLDESGRLATFDPAEVDGGAPRRVVRPRPPGTSPRPYRPRSAAERAALGAFRSVFDPSVSNAEALPNLENASTLGPIRQALVDVVHSTFPDIRLLVSDVSVTGDTASVAFDYTLRGAPAFVPFSGEMRLIDGRWVATRDSVCRVAAVTATPGC